jgi:hypothetical protein
MVAGFLLASALDPPFGVGGHSHVQLGVCCTFLVVPFAVRWGCRGVVQALISKVAHTSYKSGCGSVSRSLGHTITTLRYVLISFSLYIFYVSCLGNNLKFNLQPWPFNDAASRPLLGYQWSMVTHLTGTDEGHYMTYSNVFDCITSGQVQQYLFTCRIFSNINKCQKFAGYLAAI